MKFEADRQALLVACVTAARAVSARSIRPVLGCIHQAAGDGGLTLTGTDLETTVSAKAPVTMHDDGVAALPARQLIEILRRCGDGVVQVASDKGDGAKVSWQRSKFDFGGPAWQRHRAGSGPRSSWDAAHGSARTPPP